jgi:hypothetical protein
VFKLSLCLSRASLGKQSFLSFKTERKTSVRFAPALDVTISPIISSGEMKPGVPEPVASGLVGAILPLPPCLPTLTVVILRENAFSLSFSSHRDWVSRACLGKLIIFSIKMAPKGGVFLPAH